MVRTRLSKSALWIPLMAAGPMWSAAPTAEPRANKQPCLGARPFKCIDRGFVAPPSAKCRTAIIVIASASQLIVCARLLLIYAFAGLLDPWLANEEGRRHCESVARCSLRSGANFIKEHTYLIGLLAAVPSV